MARAGDMIDQSIAIPAMARDTSRRLVQIIEAGGAHRITVEGDGSYRAIRQYRPTWAVPLVFVKRTEECRLSIIGADGNRPGSLHVQGRLPGTTVAAIRLLLEAAENTGTGRGWANPAAPLPDRAVWPAATSAGRLSERPTVEAPAPLAAPAAVGEPAAFSPGVAPVTVNRRAVPGGRSWDIVFDTGRTEQITGLMLVGRDPAYGPGESGRLISIDDPEYSISKTHMALEVDASGVWLTDRHSTNGTAVHRAGSDAYAVTPGERVHVGDGDRVLFGERVLTVRTTPMYR